MIRLPLLSIGIAFLTVFAFSPSNLNYTLTDASRMWIEGTSSIHDWRCETNEISGSLEIAEGLKGVVKATVTLPSTSIDCEKAAMTKKAASALSAQEFPTIRFTLTGAGVTPESEGVRILANGSLELTGKAKGITVSILGKTGPGGSLRFSGSVPIAMSDFGIDPPTAMLGTLKTGDKVLVRFDLVAMPSPVSAAARGR